MNFGRLEPLSPARTGEAHPRDYKVYLANIRVKSEFLAHTAKNPPAPASHEKRRRRNLRDSGRMVDARWPSSCPYPGEHPVFRAAVFSIVLALGVGPIVRPLCTVWCHPASAVAFGCAHLTETNPPAVSRDDRCPDTSAADVALLSGEIRRLPSAVNGHYAISTAAFQIVSPLTWPRRGRTPGQHAPREARPAVPVLRL